MKLVNELFVFLHILKKCNRWVFTNHAIHQNHIDVERLVQSSMENHNQNRLGKDFLGYFLFAQPAMKNSSSKSQGRC